MSELVALNIAGIGMGIAAVVGFVAGFAACIWLLSRDPSKWPFA